MFDENFWKNVPKQFCDNSNIAVTSNPKGGEGFLLALTSGSNAQVLAFTPGHMKRFTQMLVHNVEQYEKSFGEIQTANWNPNMVSPIQVQDIKKKDK